MNHVDWTIDRRSTEPDDGHAKAFKAGWSAARSGEEYTDATLAELTWDNLGWRLARALGSTDTNLQQEFFELSKRQQLARPSDDA